MACKASVWVRRLTQVLQNASSPDLQVVKRIHPSQVDATARDSDCEVMDEVLDGCQRVHERWMQSVPGEGHVLTMKVKVFGPPQQVFSVEQ